MADGQTARFQAVIGAEDETGGVFASIGRKLAALGQQAENTGRSVEHAEEAHASHARGFAAITGHLRLFHEHLGGMSESFGEAGSSLGELMPMLGAFAAVGSAAGLVEMIHSTVEAQAALSAMSKELGMTANQLQAVNFAASMTDVPIESMDKSMGKLGITMESAVVGKNKLALAMFHKMGIALEDSHHHMLPLTTVLPEVAQALKNTADPQMRLYVATTLFGKAGRDMLPLLLRGRDGIRELTDEADRLGPALTEVDRDHLEQFNESWKRAEYASSSFMTRLSADLAPVMTPLLDDFTTWVSTNKDWISLKVADSVRDTGAAFKEMDLGAILKNAEGIALALNTVVKDTVGWQVVIEGMMALMGVRLLSPFGGALRDLALMANWGKDLTRILTVELMGALGASEAKIIEANAVFEATPLGKILILGLAATEGAKYATEALGAPVNGGTPEQQGAAWRARHGTPNGALPAGMALPAPVFIPPPEQRAGMSGSARAYYSAQAAARGTDAPPQPQSAGQIILGPSPYVVPPEADEGAASAARASLAALTKKLNDQANTILASQSRGLPYAPAGTSMPDWSPFRPVPTMPAGSLRGASPGGVEQTGTVTHHVIFENVPPGVTITTTSTGNVGGGWEADVGYNRLGAQR